ncbi:MAG: coenzyme F420-0:L-glutamate ligase [Microthrixaceae bacterium]
MSRLEVIPVPDLPEIGRGDDLAGLIADAVAACGERLTRYDVVVVTQKVVSKAEGAMAHVDPDDPLSHKPLVERESVRILRRRGELIISETRHGFVCANAGIDLSNVTRGQAALLPEDPDRSARRIRDGLGGRLGVEVGVIVSDTFGRPWRRGVTDVAIGSAGLHPVLDLRGTHDAYRSRTAGDRGRDRRRDRRSSRSGHGQGDRHPCRDRARRRPCGVHSRPGQGRRGERCRAQPCRRPVPLIVRYPPEKTSTRRGKRSTPAWPRRPTRSRLWMAAQSSSPARTRA